MQYTKKYQTIEYYKSGNEYPLFKYAQFKRAKDLADRSKLNLLVEKAVVFDLESNSVIYEV